MTVRIQLSSNFRIQNVLLSLVIFNTAFIYATIAYELNFLHEENSLLENLQALFLVLGTCIFLMMKPATSAESIVNISYSLLCFSFILRELDAENLNLPFMMQQMGSGTGRVVFLSILWGALIYYFIVNIPDKISLMNSYIFSDQFRLGLAILVMLITSLVMDKNILAVESFRLYEELAESNAYLLIMLSPFFKSFRHSEIETQRVSGKAIWKVGGPTRT